MILVTGANGFVGKSLIEQATSLGYRVRGTVRTSMFASKHIEVVQVPSLDGNTDWSLSLHSCKTVIHLAAMAHSFSGRKSDEHSEFMEHNCEATVNLARQAEKAGVKRFIFLSSTGVMGPQVTSGVPYGLDSRPSPHDAYTKSKLCAEQRLLELSSELLMEIVIFRVPVVYGPNAPGSIGSLTKAIKLGIPLPLGGLLNRRHLISIENLVDLIISCISASTSAFETFIASDNEALSTSDLCYLCGHFVGKRPRLISVPPKLLMFLAGLLGKQKKAATLLYDMELDSSKTTLSIKWTPKYSPSNHVREIKHNISS
ncbi:NAD-dependent epimerase/dehydratase family protein [Amylibacter sp.]|nr:NAD-dependent epimerase/dehydratase family protein [Amylibacter sp.]